MAKLYAAFMRRREEDKITENTLLFVNEEHNGYLNIKSIHKDGDDNGLDDELLVQHLVHIKRNFLYRIKSAIAILFYGEAMINETRLKYGEIARLKGFVNGKIVVAKFNKFVEA